MMIIKQIIIAIYLMYTLSPCHTCSHCLCFCDNNGLLWTLHKPLTRFPLQNDKTRWLPSQLLPIQSCLFFRLPVLWMRRCWTHLSSRCRWLSWRAWCSAAVVCSTRSNSKSPSRDSSPIFRCKYRRVLDYLAVLILLQYCNVYLMDAEDKYKCTR